MRKLLLATVAALGASMGVATYADAQIVDNTDGQSFPTPGTITVRLNGRFRFYAGVYDAGDARSTFVPNTGGTPATIAAGSLAGTAASGAATNNTTAGINKISNYSTLSYARLYPGFDGVAANGLKYGASLEIRQDNNAPAGGGALGSITGNSRAEGALYLRREWGYIGTDKFGTLRLGSSDQPTSLYLTGTFETFDDGGLDGDLPSFLPGAVQTVFPFADQGNLYTTNKIVYVSPQFYGVDFGVSFEPNTSNVGNNNGAGCSPTAAPGQVFTSGTGVATAGCDALSSTSTGDIARRKDLYEGLVRYRGTFGPVGIAATASYDGSGRVLDSGLAPVNGVVNPTNPKRYALEDLSLGDFGLVLTYGGLSIGGNYQVGRYNAQAGGGFGALIAKGQPNASALIVGSTYTIGPIIFGAHYMRSFSEGDQATATGFNPANGVRLPTTGTSGAVTGGQRLEQGVAAGATYSLAPGVALYASYIWEKRRQTGYDFLTGGQNGVVGSTLAAANGVKGVGNKTDASVFALGTSFAW